MYVCFIKIVGIFWSVVVGYSELNGFYMVDDSFDSGFFCVIVNKMNLKY